MKYYSDITNQLYETREQLFKAERDYKMELIAKARADEKAKKIADLEAQLAELKGETVAKTTTAPKTDTDGDKVDAHKTAETIKEMIDRFKFKYPSFEFADVEDDKAEKTAEDIKADPCPGGKTTRIATEKTAPAKTNSACKDCSKCVKTDTDGDKKKKGMTDAGYYSSAYIDLNGKEFCSEGADSWNDVKKAVREYFRKLQGLK